MRFRRSWFFIFLVLLIAIGCGKNLGQIFFHTPIDQRVSDSLSGGLSVPTALTLSDPTSFNFAVFADVQIRSENKNLLTRFKSDLSSKSIQFFVVLGDLTEDGTQDEFTQVKADLDQVGIPYYITIGNHDLFQADNGGGWAGWKSTFGAATYSVTIGGVVRFIFLDTSSGEIGSKQFDWLNSQLSTSVPFTFVGSHYPIYDGITPSMWRLSSVEERYKIMGILAKKNVYAYVGGHVHGYREAQVGNVLQFIVGSMYPYSLDYGAHGYLLFHYNHGQMTYEHATFSDVP